MSTATVNIACPPWCSQSIEDHQSDVEKGERYLIHLGAMSPERRDWILVMMQTPDGTPTPEKDGAVEVMLHDGDESVHPDEAERFALALLELVAVARRQQGVTR